MLIVPTLAASEKAVPVILPIGNGKIPVDVTKESFKAVEKVPDFLKDKVMIADTTKDISSYSITEQEGKIVISKAGTHVKTKVKIDKSIIEKLPGYDGEKFAVVHIADDGTVSHRVIYTDKATDGKTSQVVFTTEMSTVIVGGAVGTYTKTVNGVNMLNTTIPLDVSGSTLVTVNMSDPGSFEAWDQTNISTYPGTAGRWLVVWPFNGNANDISGNNRHGTVSGTNAYTTGKNGASNNALVFDGDGDYVGYEYPNTLYSNAEMVWLWKTTSTSQGVIGEFREADGSGRTAMYTTEAAVYLNNGTVQNSKWTDKADGKWNWAFYPFNPAQIDYVQIGRRYTSTPYYLTATVDMAALYNGTLSADDRRKFTYGYEGVTVAALPNSTRHPVLSESQVITPDGNTTGISIQSNKAGTKNITVTAAFVQDYVAVSEADNGTHLVVNLLYTPTSNTTEGHLNYTLASTSGLGSPVIASNDTSADVNLVGNTLVIGFGEIEEDTTKYYTVSMTSGGFNITGYSPLDTTPTVPKSTNITFTANASGSTSIYFYVNGSLVETDSGTTGSYTFSTAVDGNYNITAVVGNTSQTWILTVLPDALSDYNPDNLTLKIRNGTIQQFTTMYTYQQSPVWILNNVTVGNDTNVTTSAYWFNGSDVGIYNLTAKINESQVVWTVNVTSTPKTGLGDFVEETIIAAVVAVSAGYFWNRFRRRTF